MSKLSIGERMHPDVAKEYKKWVKNACDNPMILADCSFETYLAGWQAALASCKHTLEQQPKSYGKCWECGFLGFDVEKHNCTKTPVVGNNQK